MDSSYDDTLIPVTSIMSGKGHAYLPDLYVLPVQIVNVCFVGKTGQWVLVDAGMPKSAKKIIEEADKHFSLNDRPQAIILTHGHFDHVGALLELVEHWGVKVYAHEQELPYLTGRANYPKGDSTVNGGLISELSPLFPNHGIDLGEHVLPLPADGSVPGMPEWRWISTPGHTPGHISLFRDQDRSLIAGDAFVTVKQESLYKVIMQKQEISGPPKYFTTDWPSAQESVNKLAELKPRLAVTGHGIPMAGQILEQNLSKLVRDFERIAIPEEGRFV